MVDWRARSQSSALAERPTHHSVKSKHHRQSHRCYAETCSSGIDGEYRRQSHCRKRSCASIVPSGPCRGCKGKRPSKPRPPQPAPELTADDLALFPELPKEWQWVRLGELAWSVKDGPHFS